MKLIHFILAGFFLMALQACQPDNRTTTEEKPDREQPPARQETPEKLIELLVGEWELESPAPAGQSNSSDRLRFTEEARYIAYSGGQVTDSGAYRMNEQLRNLYFESEANHQPREFELTLDNNVMTLKPKAGQSEGAQGALSYRRIQSR